MSKGLFSKQRVQEMVREGCMERVGSPEDGALRVGEKVARGLLPEEVLSSQALNERAVSGEHVHRACLLETIHPAASQLKTKSPFSSAT